MRNLEVSSLKVFFSFNSKGATKLYFVHYSRVVIILFSTGLYKSVLSTCYFIKLGFCFSVFWFFVFLYLWLWDLCFEFNVILKSDSHLPKKLCYLLHWKPFKKMKNAFYFILKALFILKIFKFLSWLSVHVQKTARLISKFMMSQCS